jgi:hypothetical protein
MASEGWQITSRSKLVGIEGSDYALSEIEAASKRGAVRFNRRVSAEFFQAAHQSGPPIGGTHFRSLTSIVVFGTQLPLAGSFWQSHLGQPQARGTKWRTAAKSSGLSTR